MGLGQNLVFILFFHDVSLQNRSNVDLKSGVIDYQYMITRADAILRLYKPDGTCTYASDTCSNLLGYSSEELVGKYGYEFCYPADREEYKNMFSKVLLISEPQKITYRFRQKDGSHSWLNETIQSLISEKSSGNITQIVSVAQITGVSVSASTHSHKEKQ